ncbi:MAG TPA: AraC family transcriptional regulator [Verrucomicrobiae bacterium]|nr:AraC family transcriptional regulator [Verrucomicrobiae bacterium]
MAEHVAEKFNLDRLAAQVGLSKFHFDRSFKSATGVSPSRYHINLRMDETKRLPRETGQSPSDYRRQR